MTTRFVLRSPFGETRARSVVDGRWTEDTASGPMLGEELWALPGLVDAHAHLAVARLDYGPGDLGGAMRRAQEALAAGVTLILDKGWGDTTTLEAARRLELFERPDIEAAGVIIATDNGYYPKFAREIDPADLGREVTRAAGNALGWVKLIGDWPRRGVGPVANFNEDELRLAVDVAEVSDARVAIHTMAPEVPSAAVAAGVHSVEHGLFLTEDDVGRLGERGGMWVPTVLRVEETIAQLGEGSSGGRLLSEGLANIRSLLPVAVEAGVRVLAGTDLVSTPAQVGREAVRMGELGLTGSQVVESVSTAGLAATGRPCEFELGAWADAVFFAEDPVKNPGVLAHPALVMRMGRQM